MVAGVRVGDIGDVSLEDGRAVVRLELDRKHEGLLRSATALLRAKTGTKDMFVEVDPGEGKPLEEGERIKVTNTLPDDPDEFLAVLDSDTRDYLKLLITGAGKGLEGAARTSARRSGGSVRSIAISREYLQLSRNGATTCAA